MVLYTEKNPEFKTMVFYSTIFLELVLIHSQLKDHGEESNISMLVFLHKSKVIHRKCKSLYMSFASTIRITSIMGSMRK